MGTSHDGLSSVSVLMDTPIWQFIYARYCDCYDDVKLPREFVAKKRRSFIHVHLDVHFLGFEEPAAFPFHLECVRNGIVSLGELLTFAV